MAKTEVYSWRISPRLKSALEDAAHVQQKSMAALLEEITEAWLDNWKGEERKGEEPLRAAAMQFVGSIQSGQTGRAENARSLVRSRIARRHDR